MWKINPDDEDTDYAQFGRIVLQWGHVEVALDNIIFWLTHPRFNLKRHKGLPSPFSSKIELAKRGYDEIPQMRHLKERADVLLDGLMPQHRDRTTIVHGYYQGVTGSNLYMFGFIKRGEGQRRFIQARYFTQAQVDQLGVDIREYGMKISELLKETSLVEFPVIR